MVCWYNSFGRLHDPKYPTKHDVSVGGPIGTFRAALDTGCCERAVNLQRSLVVPGANESEEKL